FGENHRRTAHYRQAADLVLGVVVVEKIGVELQPVGPATFVAQLVVSQLLGDVGADAIGLWIEIVESAWLVARGNRGVEHLLGADEILCAKPVGNLGATLGAVVGAADAVNQRVGAARGRASREGADTFQLVVGIAGTRRQRPLIVEMIRGLAEQAGGFVICLIDRVDGICAAGNRRVRDQR